MHVRSSSSCIVLTMTFFPRCFFFFLLLCVLLQDGAGHREEVEGTWTAPVQPTQFKHNTTYSEFHKEVGLYIPAPIGPDAV